MASFGKKKQLTDYLYSKPSIVVLGVVVIFMGVAVYTRFSVEREQAKKEAETLQEKSKLLERKTELQKRVEYLSGERGIEEEIRKHFDVAKDGEQVVIIVDDEQKPAEAVTPPPPQKPWYQFW